MTTFDFERLLGSVLEAGGPQTVPPSLVEAALTEARSLPQRRPLVPALDPHVWPARRRLPAFRGRLASAWPIFVLMVIVALAAVGSAILSAGGARPLKLPAPFGPARNGVIVTIYGDAMAVAKDGARLMEVDPVTGTTTTLLEGGAYVGAVFSPDGRRLGFAVASGVGTFRFLVMNADGSGVQELLPEGTGASWAPDSNRVAIAHEGRLAIHDVENGVTAWYDLGFEVSGRLQWRPDDDQLLVEDQARQPVERAGWYLVNADGTGLRSLVPAVDGGPSVLSPDGSTIAYSPWPGAGHIHLLDVDTGVDRELTFEGSAGLREWPQGFSPDGTRLLIGQQAEGPAHDTVVNAGEWGAYEFRHVIVPVVGGGPAVVLGSDVHVATGGPGLIGGNATFSPDGTKVLAVYDPPPSSVWQFDPATNPNEMMPKAWLFDAATGRGEVMPQVTSESMTWQRLAP